MATNRKAMAAALATAIAIPAEGIRQYAYYDPVGILTVCYGSTNNVQKNVKYSLEECKSRLDKDMLYAIESVEKCVPGLPVNILAAFSDASFNLGTTIACDVKKSTAARYLHAGKLIEACNELPRWDKAKVLGVMVSLPGLTKRREAERKLCLA
jgi:lysozyme